MSILMRHTALWLLAAAVLLPHAQAVEGPDLFSSQTATAAEVNDIAALRAEVQALHASSADAKRRAEIYTKEDTTSSFKCLEYSGVDGFAETNGATITVGPRGPGGGSSIPISQEIISRPSVCMKWVNSISYVMHMECGLTEVGGGCWNGMKFVGQTGTEECKCEKLSPDGMSCSDTVCERDYVLQGGMQNSAPAARPCSSCITLLVSLVLFLYSY
jgi:hypothetical protein